MRVAIMQPYFFPYAGYFRLFASADVFILFDCVQFPRRGWVHRNRLLNANGEFAWLTLPLVQAPVAARIAEMRLGPDARTRVETQANKFPLLRSSPPERIQTWLQPAGLKDGRFLVDYLEDTLSACTVALGISRPIIRSSTFDIPAEFTAQARILELCTAVGATTYVNSPGGRSLYEPAIFQQRGVSLCFLDPWIGPQTSILAQMLEGSSADVAEQVRRQAVLA